MIAEQSRAQPAKVLALGYATARHEASDLPGLLDYVEAAGGADPVHRSVVVLARTSPDAEYVRAARRLRGLARGCDTAVVPLTQPSAAVELMTRVVHAFAGRMAEDLLPEFVARLGGAVLTTAVLSDVGRLRTPAPTVVQHVRGWLPGARFLVSPGRPVISGGARVEAGWRANLQQANQAQIACASPGDRLARYRQLLSPHTEVVEAPPGRRDDYWGARHWLEVAWLNRQPELVLHGIHHDRPGTCPNCGRRCFVAVCPYCSAVTQANPERRGVAAQ